MQYFAHFSVIISDKSAYRWPTPIILTTAMNICLRYISISLFASAALLSPFTAAALEVTCQAGQLKAALEAADYNPANDPSLTVKGEINAADLEYLRDLRGVKSLDLGGTTVAAYSGAALTGGATSAKANMIPQYALMSGSFTSLVFPSGITEIGQGALGNSSVENLVIPNSVTTIDAGAFSNMKDLKTVEIPYSVRSLPEMLFKDCTSLQSAKIYATVATLPANFFQGCSALTSVVLPTSLTTIGDYAFAGCTSLPTLAFPDGVQTINSYAFYGCTSLENLHTPDELTSIGEWAFAGCDNLQDIIFNAPIEQFGTGAFYNASALATPLGNIVGSATELPDYVLYNASNIPVDGFESTHVSTIGAYALSGNKSAAVGLPSTLTYLGDNAMEDWENLQRIEAVNISEVPQLGSSVWEGVDQPNVMLYVPSSLVAQYKDTPQWQDFNVTELSASNINFADSNNSTANIRGSFDGLILRLEANLDILSAQLYDVSGRCLTIANTSKNSASNASLGNNRLTIDTAPFSTNIFLVRILLSDSSVHTLKLAR